RCRGRAALCAARAGASGALGSLERGGAGSSGGGGDGRPGGGRAPAASVGADDGCSPQVRLIRRILVPLLEGMRVVGHVVEDIVSGLELELGLFLPVLVRAAGRQRIAVAHPPDRLPVGAFALF